MADTPPRHVPINPLPLRKLLNVLVLPQVLLALVLYVVIDRYDNLVRILNLGRADRHEFQRNWIGIIMAHDLIRLQSDIVTGLNELAVREADSVTLYNFLGQGLRNRARCLQGGQNRGGGGVGELRVEGLDILPRRARIGDVSGY